MMVIVSDIVLSILSLPFFAFGGLFLILSLAGNTIKFREQEVYGFARFLTRLLGVSFGSLLISVGYILWTVI